MLFCSDKGKKSLSYTHTQLGQEQIKVAQKCGFDEAPSFILSSADCVDPPAERKLVTAFIKL